MLGSGFGTLRLDNGLIREHKRMQSILVLLKKVDAVSHA